MSRRGAQTCRALWSRRRVRWLAALLVAIAGAVVVGVGASSVFAVSGCPAPLYLVQGV